MFTSKGVKSGNAHDASLIDQLCRHEQEWLHVLIQELRMLLTNQVLHFYDLSRNEKHNNGLILLPLESITWLANSKTGASKSSRRSAK